MAIFSDEANQRTFRLLKRQVWALCRHVLPGKAAGRVRFGFEDPYITGQVLTYISPFYGFSGDSGVWGIGDGGGRGAEGQDSYGDCAADRDPDAV